MPAPFTPNEKPAAATIRDRLGFVWTKNLPLREKDKSNDLYHDPHARRKPRRPLRP